MKFYITDNFTTLYILTEKKVNINQKSNDNIHQGNIYDKRK